jgi:hypothetical protein
MQRKFEVDYKLKYMLQVSEHTSLVVFEAFQKRVKQSEQRGTLQVKSQNPSSDSRTCRLAVHRPFYFSRA